MVLLVKSIIPHKLIVNTMKKQIFLFVLIPLVVIISNSCKNISGQPKSGSGTYKDGIYSGESKSKYTDESFYGKVNITIHNDSIIKVSFLIRDSANHETFDSNYEKHYTGNEVYIEQCRNDWKGVKLYPDVLLKTQNIEKVDAFTGATWSNNIFKASVKEVLKKAYN
jgi:major membrane immunogen (membrane-anchored lipoprotein)